MSNNTEQKQQFVTIEQFNEIVTRLVLVENQLVELVKPRNESQREMTDTDAYNILTGELRNVKHNEAAQKLGLSYGQVYSCRGEYTFRHIHKKLQENKDYKNIWKK